MNVGPALRRSLTGWMVFAVAALVSGRVVGWDIGVRRLVWGGRAEYLEGTVRFTADPAEAHDRAVVDLALAPRTAGGKVAYSADFCLIRPVDPARSNGALLLEIPNRGSKRILPLVQGGPVVDEPAADRDFGDAWLLRQGYTLGWVGWQWDAPALPGYLRLFAPVAHAADGSVLHGLLRDDFCLGTGRGAMPLGHLIVGRIGGTEYPVSDPSSPLSVLTVRDAPDAPRQTVPRREWEFTADRRGFRLRGGFAPGRIYELIYPVENPVVAGLGFTAVRDFVSALKYDAGAPAKVQRAYAAGISQCGRFLRQFLYQGFDADEAGRIALDGLIAHVGGAGRGSFNQRFAQPSRDAQTMESFFYPTDVPPFTADRLLAATDRERIAPRIFLSNTSYEYWGRAAALISTTPDGSRDVAQPANVRAYFFPGLQHYSTAFPPAPGQGESASLYPADPNPVRWFWRAMITNLDAWVAKGTPPPASRQPSIADGTLVPISRLGFPAIPHVRAPTEANVAYKLDFSRQPPAVLGAYPARVPKPDADGNDQGGIRLPELAVPVATYTGWNFRAPAIGAPERRVQFLGSYFPFARTKSDREKSGDLRLSLEERYASKSDYLARYRAAAETLVQERWLLPEDLAPVLAHGGEEWDFAAGR